MWPMYEYTIHLLRRQGKENISIPPRKCLLVTKTKRMQVLLLATMKTVSSGSLESSLAIYSHWTQFVTVASSTLRHHYSTDVWKKNSPASLNMALVKIKTIAPFCPFWFLLLIYLNNFVANSSQKVTSIKFSLSSMRTMLAQTFFPCPAACILQPKKERIAHPSSGNPCSTIIHWFKQQYK